MRELPEPDSYTWGANEPNVFTTGLVKAIQKQAYEDGLRDALKVVERYEHLYEYNPEFEQKRDIEALLTASQKDQK